LNQIKLDQCKTSYGCGLYIMESSVLETLARKMTSCVSLKRFLCFRVMVISLKVRVSGNTFKYVFGQTFIRASALYPKSRYWL